MFLFYRLLLAHFIADFPLQFAKVYRMKVEPKGALLHGSIFVSIAILLCFPFLNRALMWDFLILFGIIHSIQDWAKVELCSKYKINNVGIFLLDQILHVGVLITILLAPFANEIPEGNSTLMEIYRNNALILYATGYVISAFGGTITIVYLKRFFLGEETQINEILSPTEKYYGTTERILITTLIILKGNYFLLMPVLPLIRYLLLWFQRIRGGEIKWKEATIEILLSALLATCIGILLRLLL